jgi:hypothetical protein
VLQSPLTSATSGLITKYFHVIVSQGANFSYDDMGCGDEDGWKSCRKSARMHPNGIDLEPGCIEASTRRFYCFIRTYQEEICQIHCGCVAYCGISVEEW